jgi:hypothetical protein
MDLHPDDQIILVHPGPPHTGIMPATVIACFENAEGVEGNWFTAGSSAYRMCDEGVTWSRSDTPDDRAALLAARRLQDSF